MNVKKILSWDGNLNLGIILIHLGLILGLVNSFSSREIAALSVSQTLM